MENTQILQHYYILQTKAHVCCTCLIYTYIGSVSFSWGFDVDRPIDRELHASQYLFSLALFSQYLLSWVGFMQVWLVFQNASVLTNLDWGLPTQNPSL